VYSDTGALMCAVYSGTGALLPYGITDVSITFTVKSPLAVLIATSSPHPPLTDLKVFTFYEDRMFDLILYRWIQ